MTDRILSKELIAELRKHIDVGHMSADGLHILSICDSHEALRVVADEACRRSQEDSMALLAEEGSFNNADRMLKQLRDAMVEIIDVTAGWLSDRPGLREEAKANALIWTVYDKAVAAYDTLHPSLRKAVRGPVPERPQTDCGRSLAAWMNGGQCCGGTPGKANEVRVPITVPYSGKDEDAAVSVRPCPGCPDCTPSKGKDNETL